MTVTSPGAVLVLGGARSGKSAFAERLVAETGLSRHYIATGRAFDDEMRERIARHREDRGGGWQTHEEPLALAARIADVARADRAVLVDCLTLWVTNLMLEERRRMFGPPGGSSTGAGADRARLQRGRPRHRA
jgi:adenosylcobinamide kinase/adenosylcobinamide-phosphate guanylyltransferase